MKKDKKSIITLLSEEVDSTSLIHLTGGARGMISNYPHDLLTPSALSEPYDNDDPEEDK